MRCAELRIGLVICALLAPAAVAQQVMWTSGDFTYDGSGNIIFTGADSYTYDALGRLTYATADRERTGAINTQTYGYDAFGNRKTVTTTGAPCIGGCGVNVQPDIYNHVTDHGASYDAAGNLLTFDSFHYEYDGSGMMTRQNVPGGIDWQYVYTADDERVATYTGQGNWRFTLRGLDGKVLREVMASQSGGTTTWTRDRDHVYRDGLLLATVEAGGAVQQFHVDHLGTPRLVTDWNNTVLGIHTYHAFGAELALSPEENPLERLKFTGHERDINLANGNSLDYMHARYYSSLSGCFLSVDPVLDSEKALRYPQHWNRYSYTVNNPLRYTDPTGKVVVFESGPNSELESRKLQGERAKLVAYALALVQEVNKTNGMDSKTALDLYWKMAIRLGTAAATHGAKPTTKTLAKGIDNATVIATAAALDPLVRNFDVGSTITRPALGADTLHHFFANAINTFEGVPVGLERFGANFVRHEKDPRDIQANNTGAAFGELLRRDPNAVPSDVLP